MATFNSVLIGKAKGKVGNVVLTAIKGQNIVKALNDKPANPRSVAQTDNRVQMANAVLAWQFLALFFTKATALTKSTESVYNAFIRLVKSGMPSVIIELRIQAAQSALGLGVFNGNWFSVSNLAPEGTGLSFQLSTNGVQWVNTMKYVLLQFMNDGSSFNVLTGAVLEADFVAGEVLLTSADPDIENNHVYIYDTASTKITNII